MFVGKHVILQRHMPPTTFMNVKLFRHVSSSDYSRVTLEGEEKGKCNIWHVAFHARNCTARSKRVTASVLHHFESEV